MLEGSTWTTVGNGLSLIMRHGNPVINYDFES